MVGWGSAKLDSVGRNKMAMVLRIMRLTGLDVVFSDADNVFKHDPFQPMASLGDLIRSKRYDYVFQEELDKRPPKNHVCPGDGGNICIYIYIEREREIEREIDTRIYIYIYRERER